MKTLLSERLRELRERFNYNQSAFERDGVPQGTISRWERGDTPQAFDFLMVLARRYRTSADYLLGLTDDPAPADRRDLPEFGAELLALLRDARVGEELLAVGRVLAEREKRRQENLAALELVLDWIEALRGAEFVDTLLDELAAMRAAGVPESAARERLIALLGDAPEEVSEYKTQQ